MAILREAKTRLVDLQSEKFAICLDALAVIGVGPGKSLPVQRTKERTEHLHSPGSRLSTDPEDWKTGRDYLDEAVRVDRRCGDLPGKSLCSRPRLIRLRPGH